MVKKIIFTKGNARLSNTEPFLVPDDLVLEVENTCYDLSRSFITLKNGNVGGVFPFKNGFIVPKDLLFSGRLTATISAYSLDGEKIKEWSLLPIKIVEVENKTIVYDEIEGVKTALTKEVNELRAKVNELIEKQNRLAETVREIKEI